MIMKVSQGQMVTQGHQKWHSSICHFT